MFRRASLFLTVPLAWRGAVVVAAVLAIAVQFAAPTRFSLPAPRPSAGSDAPAPEPRAAAPARVGYPAIAEHPLFDPSRQPWAPPAPPPHPDVAATGPAALQNYELSGVVISAHGRTALLRTKAGGKILILSEGQKFDGWTLQLVGPEGLHFDSGGSGYDLKFASPRWPHN
ncbi:MAG TPA: hypothetical protein VGF07_08545 [Stellaceae bacterium]